MCLAFNSLQYDCSTLASSCNMQKAIRIGVQWYLSVRCCGCRRRDSKDNGPLPHAAVDLGLDMIECQMMARCQHGKASFCSTAPVCLYLSQADSMHADRELHSAHSQERQCRVRGHPVVSVEHSTWSVWSKHHHMVCTVSTSPHGLY